ncbi:MAG TPA: HNH endonuclease signature motif containing protein [Candidatus Polarisedimenticolia bacterium]|nr:HNH endonuclease signature motif containing protein [Candidatus Polarisedimenticolia bacterium]
MMTHDNAGNVDGLFFGYFRYDSADSGRRGGGNWSVAERAHRPYQVETALLQADALAVSLAGALHRFAPPLARAAVAFVRDDVWPVFGAARLEDHCRERFDRSGRWLKDLAELGEAFRKLPDLEAASTGDDGGAPLGVQKALLVSRVASAESARGWIERARSLTVRSFKQQVAAAKEAGLEWPPEVSGDGGAGAGRAAGGGGGAGNGAPPGELPDDPLLVKLDAPRPIKVAADVMLDLFRAVSGRMAPVADFADALYAESTTGLHPARPGPDVDAEALRPGANRALAEEALARATGMWERLAGRAELSWALALAGSSLARFEELSARAGDGGAREVERQIRQLLELKSCIEQRLGTVLVEIADMGGWSRLGFDSVGHYAEQRLGMSRTVGEQRARSARRLRSLPVVRQAYARGEIGMTAVLTIIRMLGREPAGEALQQEWVQRAKEATVKRLQDEERALKLQEALAPGRHAAPRGAAAQEGMQGGMQGGTDAAAAGGDPDVHRRPMTDAAWHASIRREQGMARQRLARLAAQALANPTADDTVRMTLPAEIARNLAAVIEDRRRRLAARVQEEEVPAEAARPDPAAPASVLLARMFSARHRRVPAWVGLLALLEEFAEVWDPLSEQEEPPEPGSKTKRPTRIQLLNHEVRCRDGWRCAAPGCTSLENLQLHHVLWRSRGGGEEVINKLLLCAAHHLRGEHGLRACVRGRAPLDVVWRLGEKDAAVWYRNERRLGFEQRQEV